MLTLSQKRIMVLIAYTITGTCKQFINFGASSYLHSIYKTCVLRTSKYTDFIKNSTLLVPFRETIGDYCENNTKSTHSKNATVQ